MIDSKNFMSSVSKRLRAVLLSLVRLQFEIFVIAVRLSSDDGDVVSFRVGRKTAGHRNSVEHRGAILDLVFDADPEPVSAAITDQEVGHTVVKDGHIIQRERAAIAASRRFPVSSHELTLG